MPDRARRDPQQAIVGSKTRSAGRVSHCMLLFEVREKEGDVA